MPAQLDPYYKWLGIPPQEQPANYYRLLGVERFEADPDVIDTAANQRTEHLKQFGHGEHAAMAKKLLGEIAAARLCLLNPQTKSAYDAGLRLQPARKPVPSASASGIRPAKPLVMAKPLAPAQTAEAAAPAFESFVPDVTSGATYSSSTRSRPTRGPMNLVGLVISAVVVVAVAIGGWFLYKSAKQDSSAVAQNPAVAPAPEAAKVDVSAKPEEADPAATDLKATSPSTNSATESGAARSDSAAANGAESNSKAAAVTNESAGGPSTDVNLVADTSSGASANKSDDPGPAAAGTNGGGNDPSKTESGKTTSSATVSVRSPTQLFERRKLTGFPIPDEAAQQPAIKLVHEAYEAEFSKKRAQDRNDLAGKLLQQARKVNNRAEQYVLYTEARELARKAGNAGLVIRTVEGMSTRFAVDAAGMTAESLEEIDIETMPTDACVEAAEAILQYADRAAEAQRYNAARRVLVVGLAISRKAGDTEVTKRILSRGREIIRLNNRFESARKAAEMLEMSQQDPDASLTLGSYLCLVQNDWPRGLLFLAQGSDTVLRKASELEMAQPSNADQRAELGDAWWAAGEKADASDKTALRARAAHWYAEALPNLQGLARTKVANRLDELAASDSPTVAKSAAKPEGKPADAKAKPQAPGAAARPLAAQLADAVKKRNLSQSPLAGSLNATRQFEYLEVPPGGLPLAGFNCSVDSYGRLLGLQAVYLSGKGVVNGEVHGLIDRAANSVTVTAKPGYAVGTLRVKSSTYTVRGIQPIFMKIGANGLVPGDNYSGPWLGEGDDPIVGIRSRSSFYSRVSTTTLGGDGRPVVGIYGQGGDALYALGIVQVATGAVEKHAPGDKKTSGEKKPR